MGHSCTVAYLRHCACKLFMGMDVGCYALHDKEKKAHDLFFWAHTVRINKKQVFFPFLFCGATVKGGLPE